MSCDEFDALCEHRGMSVMVVDLARIPDVREAPVPVKGCPGIFVG